MTCPSGPRYACSVCRPSASYFCVMPTPASRRPGRVADNVAAIVAGTFGAPACPQAVVERLAARPLASNAYIRAERRRKYVPLSRRGRRCELAILLFRSIRVVPDRLNQAPAPRKVLTDERHRPRSAASRRQNSRLCYDLRPGRSDRHFPGGLPTLLILSAIVSGAASCRWAHWASDGRSRQSAIAITAYARLVHATSPTSIQQGSAHMRRRSETRVYGNGGAGKARILPIIGGLCVRFRIRQPAEPSQSHLAFGEVRHGNAAPNAFNALPRVWLP
jgi:hypothetical protein